MKKVWLEIGGIFIVAGFIMFFRLGGIPLLDPDEPVYAQTAVEMLAHQDFLSPRIYGDFWYDKPPLYYWLTAASISVFGNTEFAARFPAALLAVGSALLLYLAGMKLFRRRAALFAALALVTSIEFFYLGKAAVTDSTLTFFFSASLLAYALDKKYWMYLCMALAVLTKGPVGIVLPSAIIFVHLLVTRQSARLREMKLLRGICLVLLVAGPWYFLMYHLHGAAFLEIFFGFHNVTRFLQPEHASGANFYYYLPVLLIGFFPWGAYLPQAITAGLKARDTEEGRFLQLILVWIAGVFLFFSVSQTKLVSYILPMYPPMALLVGWYADRALRSGEKKGLFVGNILLGVGCCALVGAVGFVSQRYLGGVVNGVSYMGMTLFALVTMMGWGYWKNKAYFYIGGITVGMMLFVVVLMTSIFPVAARFVSVKEAAAVFTDAYAARPAVVYVDKFFRPGFCYYTGIAGVELHNDLGMLAGDEAAAYFLIKKDKYHDLANGEKEKLVVLREKENAMLLYKGVSDVDAIRALAGLDDMKIALGIVEDKQAASDSL